MSTLEQTAIVYRVVSPWEDAPIAEQGLFPIESETGAAYFFFTLEQAEDYAAGRVVSPFSSEDPCTIWEAELRDSRAVWPDLASDYPDWVGPVDGPVSDGHATHPLNLRPLRPLALLEAAA